MRTVTLVKPIMGIVMVLLAIALFGCQNQVEEPLFTESNQMADMPLSRSTFGELPFLQGADLSYVNELQDGGVNYTKDGSSVDPYNLITH